MTRAAASILDAYLVVSAQAGDRAAFAQLVARWHRRLLAHAWRLLGDQEAAADAFAAWAYRIVSRCCGSMAGDRITRPRSSNVTRPLSKAASHRDDRSSPL